MSKPEAIPPAAADFLAAHPELEFIEVFLADLNGVLRGKRLRAGSAKKLFAPGMRLPRSVVGVDIWGGDVLDNGLVHDSGDSDGLCAAVPPGLQPVPWARRPTAQLLTMMRESDGSEFDADARSLALRLQRELGRRGLSATVAFELEFYLLASRSDPLGRPLPPPLRGKARRDTESHMYAIEELASREAFLDDLYAACERQGLPLGGAVSEAGPSQFEINLEHVDDAVRAADYALLLRRAVGGVARRHGLLATFMAKPFTELAGNGMHVHFSLQDERGRNVFDDGSEQGSDALRCAIGGLLASAPEAMLIFAPQLNSQRRFRTDSHAPTRAAWGYDNRTVAIRVPSGEPPARRFEHRIAGADANPYLVLAAITAGLLHGLEGGLRPPAPVSGNAYRSEAPELPADWDDMLVRFSEGKIIVPAFGERLVKVFSACKRQEMRMFAERISDIEYAAYLRAF